MYDKALVREILNHIDKSLDEISMWCRGIVSVHDFTDSPAGMILLNAVCMKLLSVGEEIKSLDRRTDGKLLAQYPAIPWREIMGMRDVIAHHYFDLDADEIFTIVNVDLPPLTAAIRQMEREMVAI